MTMAVFGARQWSRPLAQWESAIGVYPVHMTGRLDACFGNVQTPIRIISGAAFLERQLTCPLPTTMMARFGRCVEIAYSFMSCLVLWLTRLPSRLSLDVVAIPAIPIAWSGTQAEYPIYMLTCTVEKRVKSGRMVVTGTNRDYQVSRAILIMARLMRELRDRALRHQLTTIEADWILESNSPLMRFIRAMNLSRTRTYRIFECDVLG